MITVLHNKRIVLGVTGSIACYKIIDLASKLTQAGALVDVVMSEAAQKFVQPLAFRSVTGRPVYSNMWDEREHIQHVNLGEGADLMVIAPATANTLAKLAYGLADNLLTLTALAVRCPIMVAPAMDGGMYHHPTTQANVQTLKERGVFFAGPAAGRMASGLSGEGRMVESGELFGWVRVMLGRERGLKGRYVVVTAGPTQEPIDPVRYITNRSSGKQGVALAQAALDAGAKVTLIMGPSAEPTPTGTEVIHVESSQQMHDATVQTIAQADVLLMAAAVADFRPANFATQKIKKTEAEAWGLAIGLERTLDILSEVKKHREATGFPHLVLGFAAETQNAFNYGRDKMQRKGLDFIAINDVTADGAGFQVPTNRITLLNKDGELLKLPLMSKAEVAEQIIRHIVQALH